MLDKILVLSLEKSEIIREIRDHQEIRDQQRNQRSLEKSEIIGKSEIMNNCIKTKHEYLFGYFFFKISYGRHCQGLDQISMKELKWRISPSCWQTRKKLQRSMKKSSRPCKAILASCATALILPLDSKQQIGS